MSSEVGTFVSTFAGIEGIGLGLTRAGWRCVAQVEIDKFCRRVLAARDPGVPKFGDIREFGAASLRDSLRTQRTRSSVADHPAAESSERTNGEGRQRADADDLGDIRDFARESQARGAGIHVDLLTGGFPCQDLSVAGKRSGLSGARSGLFYEFVRVARELQPTWLLVENVPGLLSSNGGRDFAIVLRELGDAGYFVEWRVLDSRWFGVAQRRRRVFLVGHLGGPPASPVLTEPEGSYGDLAASDEAREGAAGEAGVGFAKPLLAKRGRRHNTDETYVPEVAQGLGRSMSKHAGEVDASRGTLIEIAHTLRESGFDASEDGTGRGTPMTVFSIMPQNSGKDYKAREVGVTQPLMTGSGAYGNQGGDVVVAATLSKGGGPSGAAGRRKEDDENLSVTGASVRRLTPTECERLQGFPDGWTCLCTTDVCTCPDGPRYAALGNAVTVNVAQWIGDRIARAIRTDGQSR